MKKYNIQNYLINKFELKLFQDFHYNLKQKSTAVDMDLKALYYEGEDFIDEEWLSEMQQETTDMEGLEFDLGNGNSFTYSINDQYRNTLIDKNANIDDFFDDYIVI